MYKQCMTAQSAARQRQLEQGLLEAMRCRHYDEISVSDLCDSLGVPRKSFYRYFSGKDGALYALIDHALMDYDVFAMPMDAGFQASPYWFMEEVFRYWISQKPLLDALARSNLSGILIQRALVYTKERGMLPRFMTIYDKRLREYGTMFAICGLMSIIVQWHHDGFTSSVEEMARLALQLFSQPIYEANRGM